MRVAKVGIAALMGILLLFDVALIFQIHTHGWPATTTWTDITQNVRGVKVTRTPLTAVDWSMLIGLLAVHVCLIYAIFYLRRVPIQMTRSSRG